MNGTADRVRRMFRHRRIVQAAVVLSASLVLYISAAIFFAHTAAQQRKRDSAARARVNRLLSTVREWPALSDSSLRGAQAKLRTVCRIETDAVSGAFHYQLTISPAHALQTRARPLRDPPPPNSVSAHEWEEFRRRRDEQINEGLSRLGFLAPQIAIQLYDEDGFIFRTIHVPAPVVTRIGAGEKSTLVANAVDVVPCNEKLLVAASWGLTYHLP
jgi:hypothetical protein